jgi:hypothetical protein
MAIAEIAAMGLPVVLKLIGELQAAGDDAEAERLYKQAQERFGALNVPSLDEMRQGRTNFDGVNVDPVAREAQRRAYQRLMDMGTQTGLSVEDRAALDESRAETSRQEQGQRAAILEGARARGMSGSGMELQAQLSAQQGAADRNASAGVQAASEARRRAMQALVAAGGQAGQARGQDFSEQAARAQSQDAIDRFNSQNVKDHYGMERDKAAGMADFDVAAGDRRRTSGTRKRKLYSDLGQTSAQVPSAFNAGRR